jgi:CubicO group peptidase (beta-lactamase class C family)
MIRTIVWLALPLAVASSARGQTRPRLALDPAKVDAVFKDYGPKTPGCALGIYLRGTVVYAKGYGMADLNLGVPITAKTMFDIGSTSKQFAAASVILLANEGKLSLSDDVRKLIPELPSYQAPITIDHLLRHTSGLRDYNGLLYLAGHRFEDFTDDADALDVIVRQRALNFAPGSRWDYSNTGFFLLSVIVKRVTGKTLPQFAKERLFDPLGMTATHFRDDHTAILKDRATAYSPTEHGFGIDMSDWDQTGDGAVNTNVLELAKWDANFYDPKVGGRALIDRLEERGRLANGDSLSYGRGLFLDRYRGLRRIQHGGAWAGYRARLMRLPDQGVSVVLECNVANANTSDRAERALDQILGNRFPEPKSGRPATKAATPALAIDAAGYTGLYFSDSLQGAVELTATNGRLEVLLQGTRFPLIPTAENQFAVEGAPATARFDPSHRSLTITVLGADQGPYLRVDRYTASAAELETLVGSYTSPELATTWSIAIDSGKAVLKSRVFGIQPLESVVKDSYRLPGGFVTFTRGGDGRINGFDYSASRMMRIRFDRRP